MSIQVERTPLITMGGEPKAATMLSSARGRKLRAEIFTGASAHADTVYIKADTYYRTAFKAAEVREFANVLLEMADRIEAA